MKIMKIKILLALIAVLITSNAYPARKSYGNLRPTKIVRVYDGDTFYANFNGMHPIIGSAIPIRINGVDTPEMNDKSRRVRKKAIRARDFVNATLTTATVIELRNIKRGKYFRIVADVFVDGKNLGDMILERGLGVQYFGGRKARWKL